MYRMNNVYIYGDIYLRHMQDGINTIFWRDTARALYTVYNCAKYKGIDSVLSIPLWYSHRIMSGVIPEWSKKV